MSNQSNLDLSTAKKAGPVECLGQTFESDEMRRAHYTELLRAKLQDPEFRKIEGFPIGEDEDILNLSDPPYYTACPNPWIGDFIKAYGCPYDPKEKYHREPFAADVEEGKSHPIYKAHSYHTKVPHRAIMHFILHYTNPGDVIFDGFCGTGMTGVAAQLCGDENEVRELGYRVDDKGLIYNEEGKAFSKIGARRSLLNDLSPVATFIAYNYNSPVVVNEFEKEAYRTLDAIEKECGWMYETKHSDGSIGKINYTVWSDVFICPECANEVVFWEAAVDTEKAIVATEFQCKSCHALMTKKSADRSMVSVYNASGKALARQAKQIPVLLIYSVEGTAKRFEKKPDENDFKLLSKIDSKSTEHWFPTNRMFYGQETRRNDPLGLTHVDNYYTKRNLHALSFVSSRVQASQLKFLFTGFVGGATKLNQFHLKNYVFGGGGYNPGPRKGTLYAPSISMEVPVSSLFRDRLKTQIRAFEKLPKAANARPFISTCSSSSLSNERDCLDYIFVDPPFGSNLNYSELSVFWESWLKVLTNNSQEAIEHTKQGKGPFEYRKIMISCFKQARKLLKPGRWITVEFSNTKASVWNNIQAALNEAGFIVASVAPLNKKQGGINANVTPTAVKQDLAINAYKPDSQLEMRFNKNGNSLAGVWDFILSHLNHLPVVKARAGQLERIAERDPRILYDRMVAFYIGHNAQVPLSSGEFQVALTEKFPERDGMVFLHEQVAEYDKKAAQMAHTGQLSIFVDDEKSAINWLRNFLKERPSVTSDITGDFMLQLSASWKKFESRPELSVLLDQNFIKYDGEKEIPGQIHGYLSTNFKDMRNKEKADPALIAKAKDRWYVPDPKNAIDVEAQREKRLLSEFWDYAEQAGITKRKPGDPNQTALPISEPTKKKAKVKKLKEVRTEAIRAGFMLCNRSKDSVTILAVAEILPKNVIEEDEQLQMIYDMAEMRAG